MIPEEWLHRQVGVVYTYWEMCVPFSELREKYIERSLEQIRLYREGEDPEQYRNAITARVDRLLGENGEE